MKRIRDFESSVSKKLTVLKNYQYKRNRWLYYLLSISEYFLKIVAL